MIFRIDGIDVDCLPDTIDVIPQGAQEIKLAGGQRHYIEDLSGVDVEAVFGINGLTAAHLRQIEQLRGLQGLHAITFENISCDELVDLLVYMPKVPHTRLRSQIDGDYGYSPTTIQFHQVNSAFQLAEFDWWFFDSASYSVADSKFRVTMPAAGRFFADGISGYWYDIIGGAGHEIHAQLRNATQGGDYFTTVGKFKVNSGTKKMEDAVLKADPSFVKGDIIDLDIDQITGSGSPAANSAILVVQMMVEIYGA